MSKTLNLTDEEAERLLVDYSHLVKTAGPEKEETDRES